jgi:hypothetical protein
MKEKKEKSSSNNSKYRIEESRSSLTKDSKMISENKIIK